MFFLSRQEMRSTCKSVSRPATRPNWWDEMKKAERRQEERESQERQKQTVNVRGRDRQTREKKKDEGKRK